MRRAQMDTRPTRLETATRAPIEPLRLYSSTSVTR